MTRKIKKRIGTNLPYSFNVTLVNEYNISFIHRAILKKKMEKK